MNREILASFYCDEDGKLWLDSMSVSEPETGHDGKTYFSLDHYDVDYSKTYGYVYHLSGGGGAFPQKVEGIYWRTDGFRVTERASKVCEPAEGGGIDYAQTKYLRLRNRTHRLKELPEEFRGAEHVEYSGYVHPRLFEHGSALKVTVTPGDLLDWLENHAIQDETVYCSTCQDRLPSEDLCEHCWWCDHVGWYVTPSEGKICLDPDCWECSRRRREKHKEYWRRRRWANARRKA